MLIYPNKTPDKTREKKSAAMASLVALQPDAANNRVVSVDEAAVFLGISRDTLRRRAARGEGPFPIRLGARRLGYRYADLLKITE